MANIQCSIICYVSCVAICSFVPKTFSSTSGNNSISDEIMKTRDLLYEEFPVNPADRSELRVKHRKV